MSPLEPLSHVEELEAAIAESSEKPVLLFKHSRTCGVSHEALEELRAHVEAAQVPAAYKVITVQSHRQLANEAAARLGVAMKRRRPSCSATGVLFGALHIFVSRRANSTTSCKTANRPIAAEATPPVR